MPGSHVLRERSREADICVFILMSTYQGESYLRAQLQSLREQSHANWFLYWRDDGSSDETAAILEEFAAGIGSERCVRICEPDGRLGPTASFMAVLRTVVPMMKTADCIAFADQDDVWLPEKLARGVAALVEADDRTPILYCARLSVVDQNLRALTETHISGHGIGFPASLTQNIATGCTIMMNHSAAALIAGTTPPSASYHDWWCYLMVTTAGGQVVVDENVVALYRQHAANVVGMQSQLRRAVAALRRGPSIYMTILRAHVVALLEQPVPIPDSHYAMIVQIHRALQSNLLQRLRLLRLPGLRRTNWLETLLFRIWFVIG